MVHWVGGMALGGSPLHILFQSSGGSVTHGVLLYNFLRTFPTDVTLYNGGSLSSIAVIAFLGAKHRRVSKHATFMLHRTRLLNPTAALTVKALQSHASHLAIDDQRTELILRERLSLTDAQWDELDRNEMWLSADEAVAVGLADSVAEFVPPPKSQLLDFNLFVTPPQRDS